MRKFRGVEGVKQDFWTAAVIFIFARAFARRRLYRKAMSRGPRIRKPAAL